MVLSERERHSDARDIGKTRRWRFAGVARRSGSPILKGFGQRLSYAGELEGWIWGAHLSGLIRTGENKHDYRLGNRYEVIGWAARRITRSSSISTRLRWNQRFDISGADSALSASLAPTTDPELQAGQRLDFLVGLDLLAEDGPIGGLRIGAEGRPSRLSRS